MVLHSPILAEQVTGRDAVPKVLQTVSTLADDLSVQDTLNSKIHYAEFSRLQIGDSVVSGMDYARLDADAKIAELNVLWRPLPSVVEMQGHLAAAIGISSLELRPKGE